MADSKSGLGPTNGAVIEAEIDWFSRLLDRRFRIHGGEEEEGDILELVPPPPLPDGDQPYAATIREAGLDAAGRLVLILALLPHLRPQALDPFLIPNSQSGRPFTEFGGAAASSQSGFRPTRETALFLLAGESMDARLRFLPLFLDQAPLCARRILEHPEDPHEPAAWTPLSVNQALVERVTTGVLSPPRFGSDFPAQRISTPYEWADLVLAEDVREEVEDIVTWARHERVLMAEWGLAKHVKPGYRALFHGPPGTGKTVTAAVLGKQLGLPVYRVDLSRVVSKWIGETEKNLAALFDQAAEGDMVLFFDEADALFGKRGDTRSANDRHANQQISYLLQRIEDSPGVVILASNLKANIDPAFARRFQAMVYFPMPDAAARAALWRGAVAGLPEGRCGNLDFATIARDHEISGGSIVNVLRYACTRAAERDGAIAEADIRLGIAREHAKEGRQSR
jgi:hypothetical protein